MASFICITVDGSAVKESAHAAGISEKCTTTQCVEEDIYCGDIVLPNFSPVVKHALREGGNI